MHFHGTMDEYIPLLGGRGEKSITGTDFRSVDDSIRAWVRANGCDETPRIDVLSEGDDGMKVTRQHLRRWQGCRAEVALVGMEAGGHTCQGMRSPAKSLGGATLTVSANDLMWKFFQKHPMT